MLQCLAPKPILELKGRRFLHRQKNVIEAQKLMVFQSKQYLIADKYVCQADV